MALTLMTFNYQGVCTVIRNLETISHKMMEPWEVVVVGSCMIDLTCYAPRLPKSGETLPGSSFTISFGGKGCNQCVAAKKLGAETLLVARLGNDTFGHDYLKKLKEYDIPTDHVRITDSVSSGMAQITVADTGENQIVIVPGANMTVTKEDVDNAADAIKNCKVLVCELEITPECTIQALKMKAESKIGISILNAAPAQPNLDPLYYTLPSIFCVNETETEVIAGLKATSVEEAKVAALEFINRGCKNVIVTLGEQGAVYASRDASEVVHVPAEKVLPVDTTGAGDAFVGALAFYIAKHSSMTMVEMLKKACGVATVSVQRRGTQLSFPSYDELPLTLKS